MNNGSICGNTDFHSRRRNGQFFKCCKGAECRPVDRQQTDFCSRRAFGRAPGKSDDPHLDPYEDGRQFYGRGREILDPLAEVETIIGAGKASPSGLVRVGCPATFGRLLIAPRLGRLLAQHPELRIELVMDDAFVDLVDGGLDLGVRIGMLADQTLIARKIGRTIRAVFGSPAYFAKRGRPNTPPDLRKHDCIVYTNPNAVHRGNKWCFIGPGRRVNIPVHGNFLANNAEALREAVLTGIGLAVAPTWMFHREMAAGLVTIVLRDYELEQLPIQLIYPSRRLVSAKVRAVSDFLADEFQTEPALIGDSAERARLKW